MVRTVPEHATTPRIVFLWSAFYYWVDLKKRVAENPGILQTLGGGEWGVLLRIAPSSLVLNIFFVPALTAYLPPATPLVFTVVSPGRHLLWVTVAHEEHLGALSGEYIECTKVQETGDYVLTVEGARAENRFWDEMVEILSAFPSLVQAPSRRGAPSVPGA
ncbi:hypothetical protein DFH09DRAFT_1320002 [Mycena vulgaris]|nr:hypothetical protein DFH09DRAFT_1320002 [Mycena vulgaris]